MESQKDPFNAPNFKAEDYVKNLVIECVGGPDLQQRKVKLQAISDQTSSSLKKHVYENYMRFIETAKEISHLESEMYQLSHLLIEQRNLLSKLKEDSLPENQRHLIDKKEEGDEDCEDSSENSDKKIINAIKESILGYKGNLDNKIYIHDGGLIELDTNNFHPICLTHLFLFTDVLIITKLNREQKLEFIKQYEVKKIAITNIKRGVTNGINIITPEGTKIFQCKNLDGKNEWLEKFDSAIKYNPIKPKKGPAPLPPPLQKQKSMIETKSITSDTTLSPTNEINLIIENLAPDWLISAPEEIQSLIAQRHFEDALSVIQKCNDYITKDNTFHKSEEIIEKIKSLKVLLSNVLLKELSNSQSRNLQVLLRSSRRALKILDEMGKAREASGTLLSVCSTAIRTAQRQARRNNLAVSEIFFCDLAQVASEYLRAFKSQACTSTLVVWCKEELEYFAEKLEKHYLTKGTQLEFVAKCVENVREPCAMLTDIGLDLSYHMEGVLRNSVEKLIEESRKRLVEIIGRSDEIWQPFNLQTKSNLKTILRDLDMLGIDMKSQVTGDTWINLTQSTINFCRHFLTVTEQCAILARFESFKISAELLLRDLFLAQQNIKPNPNANVDLNFVARNKTYLAEVLLPIAIVKFHKVSGENSEILMDLQAQIRGPPKPKPRSVYKTDVL